MCVATIKNSHQLTMIIHGLNTDRTFQAEALFQEAVELRGLDASAMCNFARIEAYTASYIN